MEFMDQEAKMGIIGGFDSILLQRFEDYAPSYTYKSLLIIRKKVIYLQNAVSMLISCKIV